MQGFRCMNSRCGMESPLRSIEWFDDQHVVECMHCRQFHALRQIETDEGEPIQFEVVGLVNV